MTACQASSIRRFLPSPSAALLSSVSARLVSTSSSNRLSAARLVCTFPTRAVLTGASALDQCRARVRARSRRRSDTRNYRTTGLQSIELAVTTRCCPPAFSEPVVRRAPHFASHDAPNRLFVTYHCRPGAAGHCYVSLADRWRSSMLKASHDFEQVVIRRYEGHVTRPCSHPKELASCSCHLAKP